MTFDLMDLFDDNESKIVKAPFKYLGSKARVVKDILPLLPYDKRYVEPFGGSGAVLLARRASNVEVFNDRYAGVVAVYRCVKDAVLLGRLVDWLEATIYSREDFLFCMKDWNSADDIVERAGRWLDLNNYSFGGKNNAFGRDLGRRGIGSLRDKVKLLYPVHDRLKYVLIENNDYRAIIRDYDIEGTIFYLDPPYLGTPQSNYECTFNDKDHREMLDLIHDTGAFVALSGYTNPLYDSYPWDERFEFKIASHMNVNTGIASHDKEVLWIKEAR